MKAVTYTISNKPFILCGLFDVLAPTPFSIQQCLVANKICQPGGLAYADYREQFQLGLLGDSNAHYTLPWCGRFKVWVSMMLDQPYPYNQNVGITDITQARTGTLPALTFGLLNNPYVQETIRTEVNYANINAFSESPIVTPETITGAVTAI